MACILILDQVGSAQKSMSGRVRDLFLVSLLFLFSTGQALAAVPQTRATKLATRALAPVLLVDGGDSAVADQWYHDFMDNMFGAGNWDLYSVPEQGIPEPPELLLTTLGQYQGVLWHAGANGTAALSTVSSVLGKYVQPIVPGTPAGKLILVAPTFRDVYPGSLHEGLGVDPNMAPQALLDIPEGASVLSLVEDLPGLFASSALSGTGLQPLLGTEVLYRMEYCAMCYDRRPPYDPIVGVRTPARSLSTYAKSILLTVPMHEAVNGWPSLFSLMKFHMGFVPTEERSSGAGNFRLSINNAGYVGNFFSSPTRPSAVYTYPGYVEHLYHGGIWVGARLPDGSVRVSTSADEYNGAAVGEEMREFAPTIEEVRVTSNIPESEIYDPSAMASWQYECSFHDQIEATSGVHASLGLKVLMRAMSWDSYPLDDGVVLEYRVINESGVELDDVYFGFYNDMTVGNIQITTPYESTEPGTIFWNWYDDVNGGWRAGDLVDDPDMWMMWEHDADGEDGWATSWVGCRLLSSSRAATPALGVAPVSYNSWNFGDGPLEDDFYLDVDTGTTVPGRYQTLSNGHFDAGVTDDGDFSIASDWGGLLSTGPFANFAPGDTLGFTYVMVGGADEWNLRRNSRRFSELEAAGWDESVAAVQPDLPRSARLLAAVPNPFNPATRISFEVSVPGQSRLAVYDTRGHLVVVLADEHRAAGRYEVTWDGRDLSGRMMAAGVYLYRLETPGFVESRRMTLVK